MNNCANRLGHGFGGAGENRDGDFKDRFNVASP